MDNNRWQSYLNPTGWCNSASIDPSINLYEKLFNYNSQPQQPNQIGYTGQYQSQDVAYQTSPTLTTPAMGHVPPVYNNFATTGYGYPYCYTNSATNNALSQYPAPTNLWNQASSLTPLTPGLSDILASLQMLSLQAIQYPTPTSSILGQSTPYYANIGNTSTLPNPFRLAPQSAMSPLLPTPTPPPRLRRQFPRGRCNKVNKKKGTQQKPFMQAFLEAQQPQHVFLPPPPPPPPSKMVLIDVYYVPAPQPFDTPGECRIERIQNQGFTPAAKDVNKGGNDGKESTETIDVEK